MTGTPSTGHKIAVGLRALADDFDRGHRPAPGRGAGPRRLGTSPVVPIALHDAVCGWRVASPLGDDGEPNADILHCAGCGLCYLRADATVAAAGGPR